MKRNVVARVKAFLVEQGVPEDHIETQGLGEEQPLSAEQIKRMADYNRNQPSAYA